MLTRRLLVLVLLLSPLACDPPSPSRAYTAHASDVTDAAGDAPDEQDDLPELLEGDELFVLPGHGPDFVHAPGFAEQHAQTASTPRAVTVFLATEGVTITRGPRALDNAQQNTSDLPAAGFDVVSLPALDGGPWGRTRAQAAQEIASFMTQDFAPWQVTFVTSRPTSGDYVMLVLGGTPGLVGLPASYGGIAPYDVGDTNPNDVALVFAGKLGAGGYTLRQAAWVAGHELAHSFGLNHMDRSGDIMAPRACFCDQTWGAGPVTGTGAWQDDAALLSQVLLPASGAPPAPPALSSCFADVASSFAENDICRIAELGVTVGCGGDNYCPAAVVTRAQMAVFLDRVYRFRTGTTPPVAATPFDDVDPAHWAAASIARIYGLGITHGTGPRTYSPGDTVTRGQMAAFLARTYASITGAQAPVVPVPFADTDGHFAEADIARIYGLGITFGTGPETYSPGDPVTREQMAAFLSRLWDAAG